MSVKLKLVRVGMNMTEATIAQRFKGPGEHFVAGGALRMGRDGEWEVLALPITHGPRADPADAIEIPTEPCGLRRRTWAARH